MTNEIATTTQASDIDYAEQRRQEAAGQDVLNFLDNYAVSWGKAANIAEQLARTDYAGQFKSKPADLAAAILEAATLGIAPQQVGKSIYVVHGAPTLYGKTALSLALSAGYSHEKIKYEPTVVALRFFRPDGTPYDVEYTFDRAKREGLVDGNKAQYTKRPEKMLFWKCVGEAADQLFPHVIKGMGIKEDYEQSNPNDFRGKTVQATATRMDIATQAATAPAPKPIEQKRDFTAELERITNVEDLEPLMDAAQAALSGEEYELLADAANTKWAELKGAGN